MEKQITLLQFLQQTVFEKLSARDVQVAFWRQKNVLGFGQNTKTYKEIGVELDVCIGRAQQIALEARAKIARKLCLIQGAYNTPHVVVKHIVVNTNNGNLNPDNLPILIKPIDEALELGCRASNALKNDNVKTIDDLLNRSKYDLMKIPNFGKKSLQEIVLELEKQNLALKSGSL